MKRKSEISVERSEAPSPSEVPAGIDGEHLLMQETTRIGDKEVARVVRDSEQIHRKVRRAGPLHAFLDDCTTFLSMIRDYASGSYRSIPFGCVAAIAAALLYVLNPFDLVPDAIPGVGFIDDAAVVGACVRLVAADLRRYRAWRESRVQV